MKTSVILSEAKDPGVRGEEILRWRSELAHE